MIFELLKEKNKMKFLLKTLIAAGSIALLAFLLEGIHIEGSFFYAIIIALVLSLLNAIVRPVLVFLTLPATIISLGLFLLIINAAIVLIADKFLNGFTVDSFWWALLFSVLLSMINSVANKALIEEKSKKVGLVQENKAVQQQLKKERQDQEKLISSLKRKERNLAAQISKKEKQAQEIDQEIDRLIREAIAASNKAAGKSGNKTFELTPEAKLIAANFEANRGRLPWPLEKGVVVQGFGKQQHPVVKTTTIQSNGVTIATAPSTQIRAVFEGEVMSVVTYKGSNPSVLIRHGNYITVYKNLGKLYVKKGDKVKAKQNIGEAFTNQQTGKTEIQFGIFNNVTVLNPKGWIYQM